MYILYMMNNSCSLNLKRFFNDFSLLIFTFLLFSCVTNRVDGDSDAEKIKNAKYQMVNKNEELYYLDTQIKYPAFENYPEFSKRIANTVESNWKSFKSYCKEEWDSINQLNSMDGSKSCLPPFEYLVEAEVTYSDQYVSVYLETYIFNGGAHGNVVIQTFCYDTQNKTYADITEATGYSYQQLSEACKKALVNRLIDQDPALPAVQRDTFMQNINTEVFPQASNFEKFTLDGKIVNIYYEPYSVAPYSYGIQVVSLKFKY